MDNRREPIFESEPRKIAPTLAEFAKKTKITEDKVWELIEEGQVSARFVNEAILIMQEPSISAVASSAMTSAKEPVIAIDSPFIPEISSRFEEIHPTPSKPTSVSQAPLKKSALPAEETLEQSADNFEASSDFIIFAQDALGRNTELTRELLATKNDLIKAKDERIAMLVSLLEQKDRELRSLNRKIEELATLSKFENR